MKTVNSGEKKEDKPRVVDPLSSGGGFIDPLSVGTDPLSVSALQDPLSAALFTEPSAPPPSTASRTAVGPAVSDCACALACARVCVCVCACVCVHVCACVCALGLGCVGLMSYVLIIVLCWLLSRASTRASTYVLEPVLPT